MQDGTPGPGGAKNTADSPLTQNQEKRKMIQKRKRWLKKRKRYDTIVLGMTTLDKKRSTVRKEVLFYEKDRPDPAGRGFGPGPLRMQNAMTMTLWKKRQFPRL